MLEAELVTHLTAHAGVSALVGARIFPERVPEGQKLPALVYTRITTPREHDMQGSAGLASPTIQISCWARGYLEKRQLAEQVRVALQGYAGSWGGLDAAVLLDDERDLSDPESKATGVALDFTIWHAETVP